MRRSKRLRLLSDEFEPTVDGVQPCMNEIHLCLLLMDSIDAAYRRETYSGPEWLAHWGNAVINLMRRAFPDQEKSQEALWNTARRVLWDLACAHSADELSRHFLLRPEAFFRSIVMVYVHDPLGPKSLLHDPPTLH
jgi:hypothetical protein